MVSVLDNGYWLDIQQMILQFSAATSGKIDVPANPTFASTLHETKQCSALSDAGSSPD
jgi:hypothetical protein